MTEKITLELTKEEFYALDRNIMMVEETESILEKIKEGYKQLKPPKTPVEEAFKDWWGQYPETGTWDSFDDKRWQGFQAGYEVAYAISTAKEVMEKVQEEQKWDVVRESVKWCKEHPNESVEDYLTPKTPEKRKIDDLAEKLLPDDHPYKIADEHGETNPYKQYLNSVKEWKPKPQTEEQVEEGLRSAMRKAKEDGVFDEPKESWMDKPIDELVDKLMENPPDCLKFQLGKTLEQIITRWWEDTFTTHEKWSMEECIDDLIDQIHLWFPKEQSAEGSQDIYAVVAVEAHNDLLKKIKSKLRNKKV